MTKELRVIYGQLVEVLVCRPSRRTKGLGLTKAKYQTICRGAVALAKEKGLILEKK